MKPKYRYQGPDYQMKPCEDMRTKDIREYFDEFVEYGEECNVLWGLAEMSEDEWVEEIKRNRHTVYAGFIYHGRVVGIGRITPSPTNAANGMIGYAIRPSERGKGLAVEMIKKLVEYSTICGALSPTACVDKRNERSIRALTDAGFTPTGKEYEWRPNPEPRTAIELRFGRL